MGEMTMQTEAKQQRLHAAEILIRDAAPKGSGPYADAEPGLSLWLCNVMTKYVDFYLSVTQSLPNNIIVDLAERTKAESAGIIHKIQDAIYRHAKEGKLWQAAAAQA